MKLGVISQNLMQFDFDEGLKYAQNLGLSAVEVGALGLWGRGYCNVEKLVADPGEMRRWLDAFARYELEISALGGHIYHSIGHPDVSRQTGFMEGNIRGVRLEIWEEDGSAEWRNTYDRLKQSGVSDQGYSNG